MYASTECDPATVTTRRETRQAEGHQNLPSQQLVSARQLHFRAPLFPISTLARTVPKVVALAESKPFAGSSSD